MSENTYSKDIKDLAESLMIKRKGKNVTKKDYEAAMTIIDKLKEMRNKKEQEPHDENKDIEVKKKPAKNKLEQSDGDW